MTISKRFIKLALGVSIFGSYPFVAANGTVQAYASSSMQQNAPQPEDDRAFNRRIALEVEASMDDAPNCKDIPLKTVSQEVDGDGTLQEVVDLSNQHPWQVGLFDSSMAATLLEATVEAGGGVHSVPEALQLLREGVAKKDPGFAASLSRLYASGKGVPKDPVEARRLRLLAAENGDVNSQLNLGFYFSEKNARHHNPAEAYKWFCRAAINGDENGQYIVGMSDIYGDLSPVNLDSGVSWLTKAADAGLVDAQLSLGRIYLFGRETRPDFDIAAKWIKVAAEAGNPEAQDLLGLMYSDGLGFPKDDALAAEWTRKSATQGYVEAQYSLAVAYQEGRGIAQSFVEAARWLRKAAEQGHAASQLKLGYAYHDGEGVPQSSAEAARWMRAAARQGEPLALYNLGVSYMFGRGVPPNYVLAYISFSLAALTGDKGAAGQREKAAAKLNGAELRRAQALAQECFRSKYNTCPI